MKLLFALLFLYAVPAYADHQGWSSYRGGYQESYQFTSSVETLQSTMTIEDKELSTTTTSRYRGLGFKSAIGVELGRFVRFDAYHIYEDTSSNLANSLRGDEIGGDIKLSFYGPIVNVNFGLGVFGSTLVNQTPESALRYYGQGYVGTIEIERFLSQTTSVVFQTKDSSQSLHPESSAITTSPQVTTVGLSIGLALWLN